MFTEGNINYTFDAAEATELGLISFEFNWQYIPLSKREEYCGTKTIYCRNYDEFLRLLNHWNSKKTTWKYWA